MTDLAASILYLARVTDDIEIMQSHSWSSNSQEARNQLFSVLQHFLVDQQPVTLALYNSRNLVIMTNICTGSGMCEALHWLMYVSYSLVYTQIYTAVLLHRFTKEEMTLDHVTCLRSSSW